MIQPLRSLHRRTFYAMAVILPAIFILGIRDRDQQVPYASRRDTRLKAGEVRWPSGLLATRSDGRQLTIRLLKRLRVRDPLLYCAPSTKRVQEFPPNAVLLGPVRDGSSFPARCGNGTLVLYSLGHGDIVDQLPPEVEP